MKWKRQSNIFIFTLYFILTNSTFAYQAMCFKCHAKHAAPIQRGCERRLVNKKLIDGFYLGVSAGYDDYQVRQPTGFTLTNPTISAKGPVGSILGGYGQYYDWFYYGGELAISGSGASSAYDVIINDTRYNSEVNFRVGYIASLLAGARLTKFSLLFLRLGALRAIMDTKETISAPGNPVSTSTDNNWVYGVRYGVGIETGTFNQVSFRGEFTRTSYGERVAPSGTRYTPKQSQFMLSLVYHFC